MFIRSERLFLRPAWPEEWDELVELINDEALVGNMATLPWPFTAADARESAARVPDRLLPHFFITLPSADGAKLLGSAGLGRLGDGVELGYWIARSYRGQGYAAEAARAVLSLARTLGHRRIIANHFTDNAASERVLRTIGFAPTGERSTRFSLGRGEAAPTQVFAIELGEVCGGERDGIAGGDPAMRAA